MITNLSDKSAEHAATVTVAIRGTLSEVIFALSEAIGAQKAMAVRTQLELYTVTWESREKPAGARLDYMASNKGLGHLNPAWAESPDELCFCGAVQLVPGVEQADYQFGLLFNRTQNSITPIRIPT